MNPTRLTRLYDRLTAAERATLALQAMARQDDRDLQALTASCPRFLYQEYDAAFTTRLEASKELALGFALEVTPLQTRLPLLEALEASLPWFVARAGWEAACGVAEGYRLGHSGGVPLSEASAEAGIETPADHTAKAPDAASDPLDALMDARQAAVETVFAGVQRTLTLARTALLARLRAAWEAFEAVCEAQLGCSAETVVGAWLGPLTPDLPTLEAAWADIPREEAHFLELLESFKVLCHRLLTL